jgi:hypothetical protein
MPSEGAAEVSEERCEVAVGPGRAIVGGAKEVHGRRRGQGDLRCGRALIKEFLELIQLSRLIRKLSFPYQSAFVLLPAYINPVMDLAARPHP